MLPTFKHPNLYQGYKKERNYFEGWYYKIVDRSSQHSYAIIPGIFRGPSDHEHESFVQVLDGKSKTNMYLRYGVDHFKARRNETVFNVANHEFSIRYIKMNHYDGNYQILGELRFVDVIPWPDSLLRPGSMGFYNFLPIPFRYQVICLYGEIVGSLLINNKEIDFTGGKVYIEKMWGKNYPRNYLWLQTADFPFPGTALSCRISRSKVMGIKRYLFFTAFYHDEKVYQFTTLNRSKLKVEELYRQFKLTFTYQDLELKIIMSYKPEEFVEWQGPYDGRLTLPVKQLLTGQVRVELTDLFKNKVLFTGIGESAMLEIKGQFNPQDKDHHQ